MNRLRNLLKSEKLSLSQYFEEAYKLFNEMIRDDNKDIMIIMFLSLISVLLRNIIGTLVSFAMLIRIWFFYRKVIFKIEGKRYETGDATVKSFVLLVGRTFGRPSYASVYKWNNRDDIVWRRRNWNFSSHNHSNYYSYSGLYCCAAIYIIFYTCIHV